MFKVLLKLTERSPSAIFCGEAMASPVGLTFPTKIYFRINFLPEA
jgi:hypothetical protein